MKDQNKNQYFDSLIEESKGIKQTVMRPKPKAKKSYHSRVKVPVRAEVKPNLVKKEGFFSRAAKGIGKGASVAGKFIAKEAGEAVATKYSQHKTYRKERSKAVYQERVKQMRKDIRSGKNEKQSPWGDRKRDERWL